MSPIGALFLPLRFAYQKTANWCSIRRVLCRDTAWSILRNKRAFLKPLFTMIVLKVREHPPSKLFDFHGNFLCIDKD